MNGLPTVRIDDVLVHPRENDLVLGTHGRSIWIMDDISALQQLSSDVTGSDAHVFDVRPATWVNDFQRAILIEGQTLPRPEPATRIRDQLLAEDRADRRPANRSTMSWAARFDRSTARRKRG